MQAMRAESDLAGRRTQHVSACAAGIAAEVLKSQGVDHTDARMEVEKSRSRGPDMHKRLPARAPACRATYSHEHKQAGTVEVHRPQQRTEGLRCRAQQCTVMRNLINVQLCAVIGRGTGYAVEIPFTPRSKRVLEMSLDEAEQLGERQGVGIYQSRCKRGLKDRQGAGRQGAGQAGNGQEKGRQDRVQINTCRACDS